MRLLSTMNSTMNRTMKPAQSNQQPQVGDVLDFEVQGIAHGGHCLAHSQGFTFFIRGSVPGEKVRATITQRRKGIYFAEVAEVIEPSVHRVQPPCAASRECGGCDFQHVDLPYQRELKTTVLKQSLQKFSGLTLSEIEVLLGEGVMSLGADRETGLSWRTRARFMWASGWKMHRFRSDTTVDTSDCKIVTENIRETMSNFKPDVAGEYVIAEGESGVSIVGPGQLVHGPSKVTHAMFDSQWRVTPNSFWQAHEALLPAIGELLDAQVDMRPGEIWWDLFGGSGVFSAYISRRVGERGLVYSVEADSQAIKAGKRALHEQVNIRFINSDVSEFVTSSGHYSENAPHGVLLDPPRAGAGTDLCESLKALRPRVIVYIACDPVSLSRDLKVLLENYHISHLRSWDAFPMSHHFETVAVLQSHLS